MTRAFLTLLTLTVLGIGASFVPGTRYVQGVQYLSTAVSSVGVHGASANSSATSVSCTFSGSTSLQGDGTTLVTFNWSVTPDTQIFVNTGEGALIGTTTTNVTNATTVITTKTIFTLVDSDGIATSTCNFTASPA